MVETKFEKDYSNKKPYNGVACIEGEVLVPFRISDEIAKNPDVIEDNLETWKYGGKKVKVGFFPIKEENAADWMKLFNRDVNDYLAKYRKQPCYLPNGKGAYALCDRKDCNGCKYYGSLDSKLFTTLYSSLDDLMEGLDGEEDENESGMDYTGTTEDADKADVLETLNLILDELRVLDERYPQIFSMHYEGYQKGEILNAVDLGVAKSQGYAIIDKVIKTVQKIYTKNFLD